MRRAYWLLPFLLLGLWFWGNPPGSPGPVSGSPAPAELFTGDGAAGDGRGAGGQVPDAWHSPAFLPPEAHDVLSRIARGGPFEHRQDGGVFHNRERRLPPQPRGYYREYTVETPGAPDRGPRRIVTGGGRPGASPPREYWYTADHYRSFRRFEVQPSRLAAEGAR